MEIQGSSHLENLIEDVTFSFPEFDFQCILYTRNVQRLGDLWEMYSEMLKKYYYFIIALNECERYPNHYPDYYYYYYGNGDYFSKSNFQYLCQKTNL